MTSESIIVQHAQGPVSRLILLTHGVGSVPQSMLGVARWFAATDSSAVVVSIASPEPSDISAGLQWFSVRGVTEENRQARVDAAMPAFVATVRHWQQFAGTDPQHTLIAGFSQGAIMALESTKLTKPSALHIVAIAGRFATLPNGRSAATVHFLHGEADPVMPVALAQAAQSRLLQLGTSATLDRALGVGHEPHPAMLEHLSARLSTIRGN